MGQRPSRPAAAAGTGAGAHRGRRPAVGGRARHRVHPSDRDAPVPGTADDGEIPVPVGAIDPHPVPGQQAEQPGRGVAVGVAGTHGDQRHPCAAGGQEGGVRVRTAVVGDLQDVGAQVDSRGEDPPLGIRAEVAGEEHPDPTVGRAEHQRQVVGLHTCLDRLWLWSEHVEGQSAHGAAVARAQLHVPAARSTDQARKGADPILRGCQAAGHDVADLPTRQCT